MREPGDFGALVPEASVGRHPQVFASCSEPLYICVCGGGWAGSLGEATWWSPLSVLPPQTQEAALPSEAAVLLRQARGAAEGAAHAG